MNVTVWVELDTISLKGVDNEKHERYSSSRSFGELNSSVTNAKGIFTISRKEKGEYNIMSLSMRNPLTRKDLETLNGRNELMPGFKVHWNFTSGYEQSDRKFFKDGNNMTRQFIKYAIYIIFSIHKTFFKKS